MSNQFSRTTLMLPLAFLLIVVVSPAMAQQRRGSANAFAPQSSTESSAAVFRAARDLITDGEWAKAQDKFSEYVSKFPNEKNLDAALYWLAYSQYKLSKYQQCRETANRLFEKYQNSAWLDDARLLLAQIPGAVDFTVPGVVSTAPAMALPAISADEVLIAPRAITPVAPGVANIYAPARAATAIDPTGPWPAQIAGSAYIADIDALASGISETDDDPCEFKIVVLQALFQTDVQRGILAATEWLKPGSTQTVRCKSAALTLLGRHGGKASTPVILGLARSEPDVKLRARAISTLGATNDDSVIDPLREFALNSTDNEIVEASLYALSRHSNERVIGVLTDIATSGKTTAQRKMAIGSIARRPGDSAVDALFKIYDADQSVEIRKSVIAGFANRQSERAGEKLFEIARSSDNIELRQAAIAYIPRRGGDKPIDFLISLYDTEKNEVVKDQILNAFGSGTAIMRPPRVASGQSSPDVIYTPGVRNGRSPVAEKKVVRKLIDIAKNPQESMTRRKRAIGWLSRSNDPEVQQFLEGLLRQ
ncbi:MAG TPA: HEAT repeat domain-containing protein [Pyrinomonadaceae bacterium]|nr:HEAT repeat domain-containing protein [Pyrinomonadaceae bacterium]